MNEAITKDLRVASRRVNATIPTAASRCRRLRISSQLFAREFRVSVHRNARAENVCACCIAASSPSPSSPIRRCGTRNAERVSHILKHFRLLSSQSYLSSLLYLVHRVTALQPAGTPTLYLRQRQRQRGCIEGANG